MIPVPASRRSLSSTSTRMYLPRRPHAGDGAPDGDGPQPSHIHFAPEVQPFTAPPDRLDPPPPYQRCQPADDRFHFGQLRHRRSAWASTPASAKASASRAKSATKSSSARLVPAIPLAASAAAAISSPKPSPSARRNIFRRVANACLTTSSKSARVTDGRERPGLEHAGSSPTRSPPARGGTSPARRRKGCAPRRAGPPPP